MTDGERIHDWIRDYKDQQDRHDMYTRQMLELISKDMFCGSTAEYLHEKIAMCEYNMRALRQKIMIYGDY